MKIQLQLQGAKPYPYYSVLSDVEVLADIDELHKEFVLVPTDMIKLKMILLLFVKSSILVWLKKSYHRIHLLKLIAQKIL